MATMLRYLLLFVIGGLSISFMYAVPLIGDEFFYTSGAKSIAKFVLDADDADVKSLSDLAAKLRSNGWFLPGMSFVLTPVQLLFRGEAPTWALRLWLLVINLTLMDAICRNLQRRFTPAAGIAFLLVCAASPFFVFFTATVWGDLLAMLITVLTFLWIDESGCKSFTVASAVKIGAVLAAVTYLRGMYFPVVVIAAVAFLLSALRANDALPDRGVLVRHGLLVVLTAAVLISPWSLLVSAAYGPTILTTTLPLSQIVEFGHPSVRRELRAEGDRRVRWNAIHRAVVQRARANQVTTREQYRTERLRALAPVSRSELASKVSVNVRRYLWKPADVMRKFQKKRCASSSGCAPKALMRPARRLARWTWAFCAAVLAVYMLIPFKARDAGYWLPLFGKGLVFLMLLHPFLARANGRYHVQLIPIAAVVVSMLLNRAAVKRSLTRLPIRGLHDTTVFAGQIFSFLFVVLVLASLFWPFR